MTDLQQLTSLTAPPTDDGWIEQLGSGDDPVVIDDEDFLRLHNRYGKLVRGALVNKERTDARDIEQNVWMKVWTSWAWGGECSEKNYLMKIAMSVRATFIEDEVRWRNNGGQRTGERYLKEREAKRVRRDLPAGPDEPEDRRSVPPSQLVLDVRDLIDRLDPRLVRAKLLEFIDGASVKEGAAAAGLSERRVRQLRDEERAKWAKG